MMTVDSIPSMCKKTEGFNRSMTPTVAEKPATTSQKSWFEYTGYNGSFEYPDIPHQTNQTYMMLDSTRLSKNRSLKQAGKLSNISSGKFGHGR